jgi:hypothetical protein
MLGDGISWRLFSSGIVGRVGGIVSGSKDNARVQRNNSQVWYTIAFDLLDFTVYLRIAIYQTTIVLEELPELQCGHDSGGGYCSLHPSKPVLPF